MVGKPTKRSCKCGVNDRGGREYARLRNISRTDFELEAVRVENAICEKDYVE